MDNFALVKQGYYILNVKTKGLLGQLRLAYIGAGTVDE